MTAYERGFLTKCAELRVPLRNAISMLVKAAGGGWLDYSGITGYGDWQLPSERDVEKYLAWRSSTERYPYDPISQNPRFGAYRMAPGADVIKSLINERSGEDVDFYPFVRSGFAQQIASRRSPALNGVTTEQADAAARAVADYIASKRKASMKGVASATSTAAPVSTAPAAGTAAM